MEELNEIKNKYDFTTLELADYLGCNLTTVRSWLYGKRKPHDALMRLLSIYKLLEMIHPATHSAIVARSKSGSQKQA